MSMIYAENHIPDKNDGLNFEERRSSGRMPVNMYARFFFNNMFYAVNISDISKTGMFIHTRKCFDIGTILTLLIRNEGELRRVFVKVKRMKRSHRDCDGIGVELIGSSKAIWGSL